MDAKLKHEKELKAHGRVPWIGVDLDATLAEYHSWGEPIGKPILPMLARVYKWRADGKTVKLFTARAADQTLIPEIKAWLEPLGLQDMEITNVKDLSMIELWDDRAVQVIPNTGERVDGKA